MSEDLHFSDNYRDACIQTGTGAGFQFEFYCECCNDTWRSPFEPYRSGQASGWLRQAGNLAGSLLGSIGYQLDDAADGVARAGWGTARDAAFKRAIGAAEAHFHRCARCHDYVCGRCWSSERGLCRDCAPDIATEVQAARHAGALETATENAHTAGQAVGARIEVKADRQLVCPGCGTEGRGAKFCPQCGLKLEAPMQCSACHAALPSSSRFCPECGHGVAGASAIEPPPPPPPG